LYIEFEVLNSGGYEEFYLLGYKAMSAVVSEERITYIFRVEEKARGRQEAEFAVYVVMLRMGG
jgi:hypothetical protein